MYVFLVLTKICITTATTIKYPFPVVPTQEPSAPSEGPGTTKYFC